MLNPISGYAISYSPYSSSGAPAVSEGSVSAAAQETAKQENASSVGKSSSPAQCQTCKNRKYQDGSNEMVSFKSATHISPGAAGAMVRSHEQEHVSNAYKNASLKDGKVLSATVSIHMAVCPECGRSYVSGGTTRTKISYPNESNPYVRQAKQFDGLNLRGSFIDAAL